MENKLIIINDGDHITLQDYITSKSPLTRVTEKSRIRIFETWLTETNLHHFNVDFNDYVEYLQNVRESQPATINAHLKSIRGRYRAFMQTNDYRNILMEIAQSQVESENLSDILSMVNELDLRFRNVIFADYFVRDIKKQDKADSELGIRLDEAQINDLLGSIDITRPIGLRDAALIVFAVCTGLREFELANVRIDDLRQTYEGKLAVRVRSGKGAKQRLVPYGTLDWCLLYIDQWLQLAQIEEAYVFRGFRGKSYKIRESGISVRMINYIVGKYSALVNGDLQTLRPHDLRRTYARLQYENGMSPEALQQNMGHESYDTTLRYIGSLDAEARQSKVRIALPRNHLQQLLGN